MGPVWLTSGNQSPRPHDKARGRTFHRVTRMCAMPGFYGESGTRTTEWGGELISLNYVYLLFTIRFDFGIAGSFVVSPFQLINLVSDIESAHQVV